MSTNAIRPYRWRFKLIWVSPVYIIIIIVIISRFVILSSLTTLTGGFIIQVITVVKFPLRTKYGLNLRGARTS
ncbi:MAG: hypothetical protein O4805_19685 [Trichodesmium sp. St16_bin2-tuft]|nr:hypothetical protein [Trichodesmium sp. St16_bin2-tuft]